MLLNEPKLGPLRIVIDESALILDVACGSGYSSDILTAEGLSFAGAGLHWICSGPLLLRGTPS